MEFNGGRQEKVFDMTSMRELAEDDDDEEEEGGGEEKFNPFS